MMEIYILGFVCVNLVQGGNNNKVIFYYLCDNCFFYLEYNVIGCGKYFFFQVLYKDI